MSSENNTTVFDPSALLDVNTQQFYIIQFWMFLILIIPSMLCSFFSLYHFLSDRALRQALHNHIIIVLLIINLSYECTDIPLFIHYFRTFESFMPSPTVRFFWTYIDWTFFAYQNILYAWVTVERHILIFHEHLVLTARRRLQLHYLPPVVLGTYCTIYYAMVFFASRCQNYFGNMATPTIIPCAFIENNTLFLYEIIVNAILPALITVISSIVLLMRALWQKHRAHQQIHWRRYRKMIIQVLSISSIYLIFPFPYLFVILLQLCGISSDIAVAFISRWTFCTYYAFLLFPIVVTESLPGLRQKLKNILPFRHPIAPIQLHAARMIDNRVIIR